MDHHIIAQQHGDNLCDAGDGADDFSCWLHLFPAGHGMRVEGSRGFRLDFEVNDVRVPPADPLEYYVEVAVFWTPQPQVPATYLHVAAPMDGRGPATYAVPLDDSSSLIYYNYTHDWRDDRDRPGWDPADERLAAGVGGVQGLGAGTVADVVVHAHQGVFDALFVFRETDQNRGVFAALDALRPAGGHLPLVPECHGTTLARTKERALALAAAAGGELLCEAARPALAWVRTPGGSAAADDAAAADGNYAYRDRQMDLRCKEDLRLAPNDTWTFVAFTRSRPTSTAGRVRRGSPAHAALGVFEEGFAQSEHVIARLDFVADRARAAAADDSASAAAADLYAPPALYLTQRWPVSAANEPCRAADWGKRWYSYVKGSGPGWDVDPAGFPDGDGEDGDACSYLDNNLKGVPDQRAYRLHSMMAGCPASISMDASNSVNANEARFEGSGVHTKTE